MTTTFPVVRALFVFWVVFHSAACGPRDAAGCIQQNVKPGLTDAATRAVITACNERYPKRKPATRALSPSETIKLTGRGGAAAYSTMFSGELYNGTSERVCRVEFKLTTLNDDGKTDERVYRTDIAMEPNEAQSFAFTYLPGKDGNVVSWAIVDAEACAD
jgi:hypothetical protein